MGSEKCVASIWGRAGRRAGEGGGSYLGAGVNAH